MLPRLTLFVGWSLVLWGTLLDVGLLYSVVTKGLEPTVQGLLTVPSENVAAFWGNRVCGLLALVAWGILAGARWSSSGKGA